MSYTYALLLKIRELIVNLRYNNVWSSARNKRCDTARRDCGNKGGTRESCEDSGRLLLLWCDEICQVGQLVQALPHLADACWTVGVESDSVQQGGEVNVLKDILRTKKII